MSHPVNEQILDDLRDRREEFLSDFDATEADIEKDEKGREFIEVEDNDSFTNDHAGTTYHREYLPTIEDYQRPEGEE